jgi:molybdenum cofactor cytidylyltransferase
MANGGYRGDRAGGGPIQPHGGRRQAAAAPPGLPVRLVPNPDYQEGMATSLRLGIAALNAEARAALVLLGDTPDVDPAIFASLLAAYVAERRPITQPVFGDTPGPPTLFARAAFPALALLTGDQGGRQIIRQHPTWVTHVPFPAGLAPRDIDTLEDYQGLPHSR